MVPNRGELPMYYIENNHDPIVTKEIYDEVQRLLQRPYNSNSTNLLFSYKLFCADCGDLFGPRPIHSTTYNDIVWECGSRHLRKSPCATPYLYEELLKPIFHDIILSILKQNPEIVRECVAALKITTELAENINKRFIMNAVTNHRIDSEAEHRIWRSVIQKVIVHPGHLLEFHIMDGAVIPYQMAQTTPRLKRIPQAVKAEMLQARINGKTVAEIALRYGVAYSTVRSILSRAQKSK
jgi:hypothetical protein